MMTCRIWLGLGVSVLVCANAQPIGTHWPKPEHGLRYTTPAARWDEAFPLGNGMLGALVWGDGDPLNLSLDRADLWDLRPVPEFTSPDYSFARMREWHEQGRVDDLRRMYEEPYNRAAPTKIPAGRIEFTFPAGARFASAALDLRDASAAIAFQGSGRVLVQVHAVEPVGLVWFDRLPAPAVRLVSPPFSGKAGQTNAGPQDLVRLGYPAPVETSGETFRAYEQTGAEGFRFAVYVGWRGNNLAWSIASSFEDPNPRALAERRVARALDRGFGTLRQSHIRWWEQFWRRSTVRIPNPVIERQWYLETYKFGAAARRHAPPITLQSVWTADNGQIPPWKGDYHHDLNTQLSYWPCYSGNRLEDGLGYLDWLWKTRDTAFAWTKRFYGLPGLNVPMTADLNGNQIGGWRQYTHSATTAAWLAHHFYLHWKFSADRAFLRDRAYPYLRDAAIFLEAFTAARGPEGKRTHPLSASPEIYDNRPKAWFPTVTNFDLALERWLFSAAAELATEDGRPEEALRWRRVLDELADFSHGDDGRLLVAANHPLPESHRHFSHLMAIHPLGLIDWDQGESARRTIRASLAELETKGSRFWTGYSFSWLANLWARARDGQRAERALEIFSTAFTLRNSFHSNGDQSGRGYSRFTYRPFTLEGNFAAGAAVQEMLLQSHTGRIRVFPAIPDSWRDVEFHNLRAQGGVLVSARRRGGRVVLVEIESTEGGLVRIESPYNGKDVELRLARGQRVGLAKPKP